MNNGSRISTCFILLFTAACLLGAVTAAGQTIPSQEVVSLEPVAPSEPLYQKGQREFSLESSYLFKVIRNPWYLLIGQYYKNPLDYRLATQILSFRYRLTDPSGPSFLRGSLEMSAGLIFSAILEGPEDLFVGLALGLRYYFVQPGAKLIPYLEIRAGPGWTDAGRIPYAQQTDFTFTYMLGAGLRYDVSPRFSLALGLLDQHLSNAYISEPNYGFDALGINLGFYVHFDSI